MEASTVCSDGADFVREMATSTPDYMARRVQQCKFFDPLKPWSCTRGEDCHFYHSKVSNAPESIVEYSVYIEGLPKDMRYNELERIAESYKYKKVVRVVVHKSCRKDGGKSGHVHFIDERAAYDFMTDANRKEHADGPWKEYAHELLGLRAKPHKAIVYPIEPVCVEVAQSNTPPPSSWVGRRGRSEHPTSIFSDSSRAQEADTIAIAIAPPPDALLITRMIQAQQVEPVSAETVGSATLATSAPLVAAHDASFDVTEDDLVLLCNEDGTWDLQVEEQRVSKKRVNWVTAKAIAMHEEKKAWDIVAPYHVKDDDYEFPSLHAALKPEERGSISPGTVIAIHADMGNNVDVDADVDANHNDEYESDEDEWGAWGCSMAYDESGAWGGSMAYQHAEELALGQRVDGYSPYDPTSYSDA